MRKIRLIGILILFFAATLNLQASINLEIQTIYINGKKESGYGFVVYESNDHFFLVTAKHVVESESNKLEVVKVNVDHGGRKIKAQIFEKHDKLDLALLKIAKHGSGMFYFRNGMADARVGDPVYIVCRYGGFSESEIGSVTEVNNLEIKAKLKGIAVGSSGGPLMRKTFIPINTKIVGMVYRDNGSIVKAIPIDIIKQFVIESLNLNAKSISDLPIVKLGAQVNMFGSFSKEITPIKNYYDSKNGSISLGVFLDLAFSKHFSISAEKNSISFKASTSDKYLTPAKFKNSINSYTLRIKYYLGTNLHDIDVFVTLGYSFGRMNPQINIDNSQWVELRTLGHQYSKNVKSVKIGFGIEGAVYKYYFIGICIDYEQFFNKYIYSYIVEPFEKNQRNDWLFAVRMNLGLELRRSGSDIKILR